MLFGVEFIKSIPAIELCTIVHNDQWFRETGLALAVARQSRNFRLNLAKVATSFAVTVTRAVWAIAHAVMMTVHVARCTRATGHVADAVVL